MRTRKKLIEVALPLEAINVASAREKSIRHGHPSTLHLWWARRPLAAARAVIFAQMVDDPSEYVTELLGDPKVKRAAAARHKKNLEAWEIKRQAHLLSPEPARGAHPAGQDAGDPPTLEEAAAEVERERLFRLIEELVQWENTTNEEVLERARAEIWQSWRRTCAENADHPRAAELFDRHKLPAFHDPFAGGGSLPLEAQRLGLEAHASDLNPVAVLINKAMIEIPPKFAGRPPVNPEARADRRLIEREWKGAQGLAEDVRYYGKWMRDEAEKRIGHLYPKVEITEEMVRARPDLKPYLGQKLTVIAWLWARTVKSPNPAFAHVDVPLVSTFLLATKPSKEAYVEPMVEGDTYHFEVRVGRPKDLDAAKAGTKLSGANFRCVLSGAIISGDYIKSEGQAGRIGTRMMSIVAEGNRERVYLAPTTEHERVACEAKPGWRPDVEFFQQALGFRVGNYGMTKWSDLFTDRQLTTLSVLSELIEEARQHVLADVRSSFSVRPQEGSRADLNGVQYAAAIGAYLAFCVDRSSVYWCAQCPWLNQPKNELVGNAFGRQALQMVWDFAEGNPLSDSGGNMARQSEYIAKVVETTLSASTASTAVQMDAAEQQLSTGRVVSSDPPYYDNIGYADLSDFFYVWLRRSQRSVFPDIFATVEVPKREELVATPARHGGRDKAEEFFVQGMSNAMSRLATQIHPSYPTSIYYAFRQAERDGVNGSVSTGWELFLHSMIQVGFSISGTWPIRTERSGGVRNNERNSLATSVVLVCRPRPADAPTATRREFVAALKEELPQALKHLQKGNIAPVDLQQAAIGPGMAVYTRYAKVLDAAGQQVTVREALALINQVLDEVLAEQEGDFDADTRWALAWFEQFGFGEAEFGVAETLSKAKNTSVNGIVDAGVAESKAGKVRLLRPKELSGDWDPTKDSRLTVWEMVHHLVRALDQGEQSAAALVAKLGSQAEVARELAYRLYSMCERKKRAAEALDYNALVQAWPELLRLATKPGETVAPGPEQLELEEA